MISVTEIILIIVGILAVILGYLIPSGKGFSEEDAGVSEQKISEMVRHAIKNSQGQIDEMLDDCMEEAINKAERAMDRVTNEKMSAISEYSDTGMNDIHKNHDEVMFMYDMLNDKHKNLKNTVSEVDRVAKEAKQTAKEVAETAEQAEAATREMSERQILRERMSETLHEPEPVYEQKHIRNNEVISSNTESVVRPTMDYEPKQNSVSTYEKEENVEFASLTAILDRADEAAAAKTQNKVIRSENYNYSADVEENTSETLDKPVEAPKAKIYEAADDMSYLDEDEDDISFKPDKFADTADAPIGNAASESTEIPASETYNETAVTVNSDDGLQDNNSPAKVVSIAEASKKKSQEEEENAKSNVNDPASRNQKILDMHKAGKSAVVIARELRLGIGEVKLVIDLAGKHKKNRSSII